jgi:hypothetical protein
LEYCSFASNSTLTGIFLLKTEALDNLLFFSNQPLKAVLVLEETPTFYFSNNFAFMNSRLKRKWTEGKIKF